jgi:hypothetical protein
MSRKSSRRVKSTKQSKAKQSKTKQSKMRRNKGRKSVSKKKSKTSKVMKGGVKKYNVLLLEIEKANSELATFNEEYKVLLLKIEQANSELAILISQSLIQIFHEPINRIVAELSTKIFNEKNQLFRIIDEYYKERPNKEAFQEILKASIIDNIKKIKSIIKNVELQQILGIHTSLRTNTPSPQQTNLRELNEIIN